MGRSNSSHPKIFHVTFRPCNQDTFASKETVLVSMSMYSLAVFRCQKAVATNNRSLLVPRATATLWIIIHTNTLWIRIASLRFVTICERHRTNVIGTCCRRAEVSQNGYVWIEQGDGPNVQQKKS